jgi:pilus assembly protein CpaF
VPDPWPETVTTGRTSSRPCISGCSGDGFWPVEKLDLSRARDAVASAARQLVTQAHPSLLGDDRELVIRRVIEEAVGFGPLEPLLQDPTISEVMVNAPDEVYFERDGIIYLAPCRFRDAAHIMRIVERIIAPLGRRVDESSPYVDARLPDGSRVNVVIPPLVPKSPVLTIRKFSPTVPREDLVKIGTMTQAAAISARLCATAPDIVVSGGTGTGKTTLLNAIRSTSSAASASSPSKTP